MDDKTLLIYNIPEKKIYISHTCFNSRKPYY